MIDDRQFIPIKQERIAQKSVNCRVVVVECTPSHVHKVFMINFGAFTKSTGCFFEREPTEIPPCTLRVEISAIWIKIALGGRFEFIFKGERQR